MKKINNKKVSQRAKNFFYYVKYCLLNNDYYRDLELTQHKWKLPIEDSNLNNIKKMLMYVANKNKDKKIIDFQNDVKKILNKYEIGSHWEVSLMKILITGELFLPNLTFNIESKDKNNKEKSLSLKIGPYTTKKDIDEIWPIIEKEQKNIWSKVKKVKISNKTIENTLDFLEGYKIKSKKYKLEKYKSILNNVKKMDIDREDKNEAIEILKQIIEELKDFDYNDLDVTAKLWPNYDEEDISVKADKKRANKHRQARRRLKMTK